jgi:glycolate oxidase FAD binding subunit
MKIFLASGEQIKAGGKVVKNVAGYDMCKLFVGSLGTLGIIVEVTVRMAPLPETVATLMGSGSLRAAHGFAAELARSTLLPAALFVLNPSASRLVNIEPAASAAVVWFEGFEETLVRQLRDSEAVARRHGLKTEVWREADHDRLWTEIGDFPLRHGHLVYGLTVPRASLAEIMQKIEEENSDFQADVIGDVSSGTLWLSTALTDEAARWFSQLVGLAEKRRGHAVMFAAPAKFKVGVDVWGAAPPGFAIMREIKQRFDPLMILNPGRFVGGL